MIATTAEGETPDLVIGTQAPKLGLDMRRAMADAEGNFLNTDGAELNEMPFQQGLVAEAQQDFWLLLRRTTQAVAEPGGEDHRPHGAALRAGSCCRACASSRIIIRHALSSPPN